MQEGKVFQQKLLEKGYFIVKMTGPSTVRLTSSDFIWQHHTCKHLAKSGNISELDDHRINE